MQDGLIALLPRVVDLARGHDISVIAAGGIVDERGYVAALALGAHGVALGTRFELQFISYRVCDEINFQHSKKLQDKHITGSSQRKRALLILSTNESLLSCKKLSTPMFLVVQDGPVHLTVS